MQNGGRESHKDIRDSVALPHNANRAPLNQRATNRSQEDNELQIKQEQRGARVIPKKDESSTDRRLTALGKVIVSVDSERNGKVTRQTNALSGAVYFKMLAAE